MNSRKKNLLSDIQSKLNVLDWLTSLIPFSRVNKHSVLSLLVLTEKLKHIWFIVYVAVEAGIGMYLF